MPRFTYDAFTVDGARTSGEINAESAEFALDQLVQRGLTPVDISQGVAVPWWAREVSLTGDRTAPKAELERFFSSLSIMLAAKFPLPKALLFSRTQIKHRSLASAVEHLKVAIEDGQSLDTALTDVEGVFPERYRALLVLGEASNSLEDAVSAAAKQLSFETSLSRDLRAALVYPVLLLIMSVIVLAIIILYLAPTLIPVFEASGSPPPGVLAFMDNLGGVLRDSWPIALGLAIAAVLCSRVLVSRISTWFSPFLLNLPALGSFLRRRESLRGLQGMHVMLRSGAHLTAALSAAAHAVSLPAFSRLFSDARARIEAGESLSAALAQSRLLDDLAKAMIVAGDEGDNLVQTLDTAIGTLTDETKKSLTTAVRLLTPLLTIIIGGLVTAVMLSTISAIMDLNDAVF